MKDIDQNVKDTFHAQMLMFANKRTVLAREERMVRVKYREMLPIKTGDCIRVLPATEQQLRTDAGIPKDGYEKAWIQGINVHDDGNITIRVALPKKDGTPSKCSLKVWGDNLLENIELIERTVL